MKNKIERVWCVLCKGKKTTTIFISSPYTIVKCTKCDLVYLSPRPTQEMIREIYKDEYFQRGDIGSGYTDYNSLQSDLEQEAQRRIKLIQQYIPKGTVLDAGCGYGDFLIAAQKHGFTPTGCDISQSAISFIKQTYKLPAVVSSLVSKDIPKGPFDVITSWDVIEHMIDPIQSLAAFGTAQRKGGYLFMTTPDIKSIDAWLLGRFWYGFKRIPEHLYYFSPQTMKKILETTGYEVIDIRPWGFQRNLAYCIDQIGRYNKLVKTFCDPFSKLFGFKNISLFFPFIDMMVVARKK